MITVEEWKTLPEWVRKAAVEHFFPRAEEWFKRDLVLTARPVDVIIEQSSLQDNCLRLIKEIKF